MNLVLLSLACVVVTYGEGQCSGDGPGDGSCSDGDAARKDGGIADIEHTADGDAVSVILIAVFTILIHHKAKHIPTGYFHRL